MTALPLGLPPPDINKFKLATVICNPVRLFRVSAFDTNEPYFGRTGANRFDDPERIFGTCYFGYSLRVAIAETLLHDEIPIGNGFEVTETLMENRFVIRVAGDALRLANLTGVPLKRLGGHADLSATVNYGVTQAWSRAVYDHPALVDGFIYMSRHLNSEKAVVLFDRCQTKFIAATAVPLIAFTGFAAAIKTLGIVGSS